VKEEILEKKIREGLKYKTGEGQAFMTITKEGDKHLPM
jgi:hypothetical protein